jgi:class 3 adenylate cyclase
MEAPSQTPEAIQIQAFVDHGLNTLGLHRNDIVFGTAGDNAILIFDDAATMHRFAQTVQQGTLAHNQSKSVELAKRWFRMGAATGTVVVRKSERRIIGTTITRAVRLEAAAHKGQLVIDLPTFDALPQELKEHYSVEEVVKGKRQERFKGRRCTFVDVQPASNSQVRKKLFQLGYVYGQYAISDQSARPLPQLRRSDMFN